MKTRFLQVVWYPTGVNIEILFQTLFVNKPPNMEFAVDIFSSRIQNLISCTVADTYTHTHTNTLKNHVTAAASADVTCSRIFL